MEDSNIALALIKTETSNAQPVAKSDNTNADIVSSILNFKRFGRIPLGYTLESFSRLCSSYQIIDGQLYKGIRNPKRVIREKQEQHKILNDSHIDETIGAHKSAVDTANSIQERYFWKSVLKDAKDFVSSCDVCRHEHTAENEKVWFNLKLVIHGPYPTSSGELKHFLLIIDDISGWLVGKVVSNEHLSKQIALFLFSTMCSFGFAKCNLSMKQEALFQGIHDQFDVSLSQLQQKIPINFTAKELLVQENNIDTADNETSKSFSSFVASNYDAWENMTDLWLFQKRISDFKNAESQTGQTPFWAFFQRDPFQVDFRVSHTSKKRRKLKRSLLICRHCRQVFTSRISFRIHQKRHIEEARLEGIAPGEGHDDSDNDNGGVVESPPNQIEENPKQQTQPLGQKEDNIDPTIWEATKEAAVNAVQTLMKETRDERGKRGKYFKYSHELREQIAEYAQKFGTLVASEHFTQVLGNPVSESTIRNFVKNHLMFSPDLKEEIGKHAYQFGIDASFRLYRQKLSNHGLDLKKVMIKQLKDAFVAKHPDLPLEEEEVEDNDNSQPLPGSSTDAKDSEKQKFIFDPSLKIDIGRYAFHCGNTNAVHHFSTKLRFPMKESMVRQFKKSWMEKNGVDVMDASENQEKVLDLGVASSSDIPPASFSYDQTMEESQSAPLPLTVDRTQDCSKQINIKPVKLKRRQGTIKADKEGATSLVKRIDKRSKRGQYAIYAPELRAEIAKYASDHGNQETINHFRQKLNLNLPESTVRGLRDKYLSNPTLMDNTIDHGKRGRPMRLGKYDSMVQECIRQLVASGEKPTSFLVVATAKQVLLENDPDLLKDGGGSMLSMSWAKSFLKRMKLKSTNE